MTIAKNDQEAVLAWMESLGWRYYNDTFGTYGYLRSGFPMLDVDTAAFFYQAHQHQRTQDFEMLRIVAPKDRLAIIPIGNLYEHPDG